MMIELKHFTALFLMVLIGNAALIAAPDDIAAKSIERLSSEDFTVRESGYSQIKKWAEQNLKTSPELLHSFWTKQSDPEVTARAYSLMSDAFFLRLKKRGSGFVGIGISDVFLKDQKERIRGVMVSAIHPNMAGERAGLQVGDVVITLDGVSFENLIDLYRDDNRVRLSSTEAFIYNIMIRRPKSVVTMDVVRDGKELVKKITLIERPESAPPNPLYLEALFKHWLDNPSR